MSCPLVTAVLALLVVLALFGARQTGYFDRLSNQTLFPAPKPTYDETFPGLTVHTDSESKVKYAFVLIPPVPIDSEPYLVYFHGNNGDIGSVYQNLVELASQTSTNVVAVEYPGYGVLHKQSPTAKGINSAAQFALDYLIKRQVSPNKIVIYGWSIGTGPATRLAKSAADRGLTLGGLILQAPYTSIHAIASDRSYFGPYLIPNSWKNDVILSKLQIPLLIIHGELDKNIGVSHGKRLYKLAKSENKRLIIPPHMTHFNFDLAFDIIYPVRRFLRENL